MTTKDKVGLGVLLALFVLLGVVLVWTFKPTGPGGGDFQNNVIVNQRMINVQKNR